VLKRYSLAPTPHPPRPENLGDMLWAMGMLRTHLSDVACDEMRHWATHMLRYLAVYVSGMVSGGIWPLLRVYGWSGMGRWLTYRQPHIRSNDWTNQHLAPCDFADVMWGGALLFGTDLDRVRPLMIWRA
jgi:hypothetical protein